MSNESKDATLQCVHILTVSFLSCHSIPDLIVIDYFNSYLNRPFHAPMHSHSHAAVMRHNWFVLRILSVCISVEQTDFFAFFFVAFSSLLCFFSVETKVQANTENGVSSNARADGERQMYSKG